MTQNVWWRCFYLLLWDKDIVLDVITMYGYGNIGNGQQLEVSSANGLSNLRDESKNGKFNSTSISYKKIHELGTTKLSYGQTEYKLVENLLIQI